MKIRTTITIIIVLIVTIICASCGKVKNYEFSPIIVKGKWKCDAVNIVCDFTTFDDDYYDYNCTIIKNDKEIKAFADFKQHSNLFWIDFSNTTEPGTMASVIGYYYKFHCKFYDGYFIATAVDNYDICSKGEELTFILQE